MSFCILTLAYTSASAFANVSYENLNSAVSTCARELAQDFIQQMNRRNPICTYQSLRNEPEIIVREVSMGVGLMEILFKYQPEVARDSSCVTTHAETFKMSSGPFCLELNMESSVLVKSEERAACTLKFELSPAELPTVQYSVLDLQEGYDFFGRRDQTLDRVQKYIITQPTVTKIMIFNSATKTPSGFTLNHHKYRICLETELKNFTAINNDLDAEKATSN
jgi:hypothetical protein